jgi:hypothetical protein
MKNRFNKIKFLDRLSCLILVLLTPVITISASELTKNQTSVDDSLLWYSVEIGGEKVGHAAIERKKSAGIVRSKMTTYLEIKRGDTKLIIENTEQSKETVEGNVLSFESREKQGKQVTVVQGVVTDNAVLNLTVKNGSRTSYKQQIWNPNTLLIEGQRLKSIKKGLREGIHYQLNTYLMSAMRTGVLKVTVGATTDVNVKGKVKALTAVSHEVVIDDTLLKMNLLLDNQHQLNTMTMDLMGSKMVLSSVSQTAALAKNALQGNFFKNTLVESPKKISFQQTQNTLQYSIQSLNKAIKFLSSDEQQVTLQQNGKVSVVVKPLVPREEAFPYVGNAPELVKYLMPNLWVQNDNVQLKNVALQVVGKTNQMSEAATKLETFVRGYITTKNLSVGYASALDVLNDRVGDCTEHALLLTGLMKSVGIPARIATGVVYSQEFSNRSQIFVPHAWSQAYIGGQWISFDAAVGSFGSGHILLSTGNGDPVSFYNTVNSIGNFKIVEIAAR